MQPFKVVTDIRWADLDPNFHVLHSKYYDLGAHCRMTFFIRHGLTPDMMQAASIGPILFSEQCRFRREIVFGDAPEITLMLSQARKDYSRWTIRHEIWTDAKTLAATLECSGAWLNTKTRKLTVPPPAFTSLFENAPRAPEFKFETKEG